MLNKFLDLFLIFHGKVMFEIVHTSSQKKKWCEYDIIPKQKVVYETVLHHSHKNKKNK